MIAIPFPDDDFHFSRHALIRMQQRRISRAEVEAAVRYGRLYFARDAYIYVIGQSEIRKFAECPGVTSDLDGLHVICHKCGSILTCYRNPRQRRPRK